MSIMSSQNLSLMRRNREDCRPIGRISPRRGMEDDISRAVPLTNTRQEDTPSCPGSYRGWFRNRIGLETRLRNVLVLAVVRRAGWGLCRGT